jgi:superfamily I DNA/RNA helicase
MYRPKFNTDDVTVYLAPAGGGKTHRLMDDIIPALEIYRPDEVALTTFTRKGVSNAIARAMEINKSLKAEDLVYWKTFHALCFKELGLKHSAIIEHSDMARFNELLGFDIHLSESFENQSEDDKLLTRYDAIRSGSNKGIIIEGAYDEERYERLIAAYEAFKKTNGLVDFYDCLTMFRDRGKPIESIKYLCIDEAQDLTDLQWEVAEIAFAKAVSVRIAGDDYQSLFTYAGASPATLIDMTRRYNTIKLEKSYRLSEAVYRFSKGITSLIQDKVEKDFVPVSGIKGFVREFNDRYVLARKIRDDLAQNGYQKNRWYVLFRNNCFIQNSTEMLEMQTIPYHTSKGFVLTERDLNKILRYMNYRKEGYGGAEAKEAFCKEYNIANIHDSFVESDLIPSERKYVYEDYVNKYGIERLIEMSKGEPFLLLSTTHRVKGGEADFVAVFLECTRRVSENILLNVDEELRVLYVACTRARIGLYLMQSEGRYGLDKLVELVKEHVQPEEA